MRANLEEGTAKDYKEQAKGAEEREQKWKRISQELRVSNPIRMFLKSDGFISFPQLTSTLDLTKGNWIPTHRSRRERRSQGH